MASWRDRKAMLNRAVHATFKIPANLYREDAPPVLVNVRVHNLQAVEHGDLPGQRAHFATIQDVNPILIFWNEECVPENGDVICPARGEVYRVDNVHPSEPNTTKAEVTRYDAAEAAAYDPPA